MVEISAFRPHLISAGEGREQTSSAIKLAASFGEGPAFTDSSASASRIVSNTSHKIEVLSDVRAYERNIGIIDVTLAATEAIEDVLVEMKSLAARLRDESLADDHRAILTSQYDSLIPRLDEITAMATFGRRNLINPEVAELAGNLNLPGGQTIEASNLGVGRGVQVGGVVALEEVIVAIDEDAFNPPLGGYNSRVFNSQTTTMADGTLGQTGDGSGPIGTMNVNGTMDDFTLAIRIQSEDYTNKNIFQLAGTGEYFATRISGFIDINNRLIIQQYRGADAEGNYYGAGAGLLVGPAIEDGRDFEWTVKVDEFGQIHGYVDGIRYGSSAEPHYKVYGAGDRFNITLAQAGSQNEFNGPLGSTSSSLNGTVGHFAVYDKALSDIEIKGVYLTAKAGMDNWQANGEIDWGNAQTDRWSTVSELLDASLAGVGAFNARIGGAARTASLSASMHQRLADAMDLAASRLVDRDMDRIGALQAAGKVREQLAQSMMQSQTALIGASVSLFSNALSLFEVMNNADVSPQVSTQFSLAINA